MGLARRTWRGLRRRLLLRAGICGVSLVRRRLPPVVGRGPRGLRAEVLAFVVRARCAAALPAASRPGGKEGRGVFQARNAVRRCGVPPAGCARRLRHLLSRLLPALGPAPLTRRERRRTPGRRGPCASFPAPARRTSGARRSGRRAAAALLGRRPLRRLHVRG